MNNADKTQVSFYSAGKDRSKCEEHTGVLKGTGITLLHKVTSRCKYIHSVIP